MSTYEVQDKKISSIVTRQFNLVKLNWMNGYCNISEIKKNICSVFFISYNEFTSSFIQ